MQLLLRKPPPPTWHGFAPNLVEGWLRFVRTNRERFMRTEPERLRHVIERLESRVQYTNEDLATMRRELAREQSVKTDLELQLVPPPPEVVADEMERLATMPEVLGTRVTSNGELVIMVRGRLDGRDLGDFELSLYSYSMDKSESIRVRFRIVRSAGRDLEFYRLRQDYNSGSNVYLLRLTNENAALLPQGRIHQFVELCLEQIRAVYPGELTSSPATEEEPEQIWDGFTANPYKALLALLEQAYYSRYREQLIKSERSIHKFNNSIDSYIQEIRQMNAELRTARAELAGLEAIRVSGLVYDDDQLREELRYITRLPGVMGMRFTSDGIPQLHVRLSHLSQDNRRYDFGDMQITLRLSVNHAAVVNMVLTRVPISGGRPFYWSSRETLIDGTITGEFCHGNRAKELRLLLSRGDFGQFVHLLLNTLESVNSSATKKVSNVFTEIPRDYVWYSQPSRRPRRRLRVAELPDGFVEEAQL